MGVHNMAKWNVDCNNKDMVNSPPHYNKYGVECIEAIQNNKLNVKNIQKFY